MNKSNITTAAILSIVLISGCSGHNMNSQSANDRTSIDTGSAQNQTNLTANTITAKSKFNDVKSGQWFEQNITWASSLGLIDGYPDGSFQPDKALTRAEVIKIIKLMADKGYITLPAPTPTTSAGGTAPVTVENFVYTFKKLKDPSEPSVIIDTLQVAPGRSGSNRASGTLKLPSSDFAKSDVLCLFYFFDKNGKQFAEVGANAGNVGIGETGQFNSLDFQYNPNLASAKVKIYKIQQAQ